MMAATSTTAQAEPSKSNSKQEKIHIQLVRYYHAAGYIKTIGAVAHRTIYSSNSRVRHRWRGAVRYLNHQKADAERQLAVLRAPPQPPLPPHYSALMCIHHYEGSWTDSGAPFWGGLQMNEDFMATYAAAYAREFHVADPYKQLGTADHWAPIVQMWVAEEAIKSRGFYPWPNTARSCGLI